MSEEEAWNELVNLLHSWEKRGLSSAQGFVLLTTILGQSAFAANIPLPILQCKMNELLHIIYDGISKKITNKIKQVTHD